MITLKKRDALEYLEIANESATAKIALQGAHIFFYQAKEKEPLLWLSHTSSFTRSKAIRGGIPICWPWFGAHESDKSLPKHGFARNVMWKVYESIELNPKQTKVRFVLESTPETKKLFPYDFELYLEVLVGSVLEVSLTTKNCDSKDFYITDALHSYFSISNITKVALEGLEDKPFYNQLDQSENRPLGEALRFTDETDRIYHDITEPLSIIDSKRAITIKTKGSNSCVVWNPWEKVASTMPDLEPYQEMLCVETANVMKDKRLIRAGESHTLQLKIDTLPTRAIS